MNYTPYMDILLLRLALRDWRLIISQRIERKASGACPGYADMKERHDMATFYAAGWEE